MNVGDEQIPEEKQPGFLSRLVTKIEEVFFAVILFLIVGFGLLPIILRVFFDSGVTWTEPLTRQFVLWLALFGAGAATHDRKHITIDVVGHFVALRWRPLIQAATSLFASVICGILTWHSFRFVRDERAYETPSTVASNIPEWIFELVLPVGFALLAIRLFLTATADILSFLRNLRSGKS